MPLFLAVANLDGGEGESTITLNLAVELRRDAHRVVLVDAGLVRAALKLIKGDGAKPWRKKAKR